MRTFLSTSQLLIKQQNIRFIIFLFIHSLTTVVTLIFSTLFPSAVDFIGLI